jgi:hypothetical protein
MAGPQCALKGGNFGFHTFMRVGVKRCRLIVLNFSQPQGTPTDGIVQSVEQGKYLHVDFEDSLLMGYKVFGVRVHKETEGEIGYSVRGSVRAYVQFQQSCPSEMLRLGSWPAEGFDALVPPAPTKHSPVPEPVIEDVRRDMCEVSPFVWRERLCLLECERPAQGGSEDDYRLVVRDVASGKEMARFGKGFGLASALVADDRLYVFASRYRDGRWNDVNQLDSADLINWREKVIVRQIPTEHLFNSSVCRGRDGYFVLAYETDDPEYQPFTVKFARSRDLEHWTRVEGAVFGADRYAACPCIRYASGYYYVLYLEHRAPRWFFETYVARSPNLYDWQLSAANPVLSPHGLDEGINASDPDIAELDGKTYLYYSVGDQRTWMNIKRAIYPMPLTRFLAAWFKTPGVPDVGSRAR